MASGSTGGGGGAGDAPFDALILAGERPTGDPLAAEFGVPAKAMIRVGGEPMVARVAQTVRAHPAFGAVTVVSQRPERLATLLPAGVAIEASAQTIATTLAPRLGRRPLLVTTADHPLLTAAMIDEFLAGAGSADVAVGLVERATMMARYPESRRTWLKFRGTAFSGTNLFALSGARVLPLIDVWARVEQQRKRGRALMGAFGPFLLSAIALRALTIDGALDRVGRRFDLSLRAVRMPQAEACIDVDSVADHALVERILAARSG